MILNDISKNHQDITIRKKVTARLNWYHLWECSTPIKTKWYHLCECNPYFLRYNPFDRWEFTTSCRPASLFKERGGGIKREGETCSVGETGEIRKGWEGQEGEREMSLHIYKIHRNIWTICCFLIRNNFSNAMKFSNNNLCTTTIILAKLQYDRPSCDLFTDLLSIF